MLRTPVAPVLDFYEPNVYPGGAGVYNLGATYLQTVVIECSTNLVDWSPYSTNLISGGTTQVNFDSRAGPLMFFRARE
jgi:hypothetical protein